MKIKVLGSSSLGNCYLVWGYETNIIIECGVHFDKILKGLNFDTSKTELCLISHEHKDHSKYAKDVLSNNIKIFTNRSTKESIQVDKNKANLISLLKPKKPVTVGNWKVTAFELNHDVPNYGFLIYNKVLDERLLFVTDTYFVKYWFEDIDYLLVECNYDDGTLCENVRKNITPKILKKRLSKSHMSLEQSVKFCKKNVNPWTKVYPIHMSEDNIDKKKVEKSFTNIGKLILMKYWKGEEK